MTKKFDVNSCIGIYDGDTLQEERIWLRKNARLVYYDVEVLIFSSVLSMRLTSFEVLMPDMFFIVDNKP